MFRVVTRVAEDVSCGSFVLLFGQSRGWFRVAPTAYRAWGAPDLAHVLAAAWRVARREGAPPTELASFDRHSAWLARVVREGVTPFVRAHLDDFLELEA